jgi:hypothetical protein
MPLKASKLQGFLVPVVFDLSIYDAEGNLVETIEHTSFRKVISRNGIQSKELEGKFQSDADILEAYIVKTGFVDEEGNEIPPSSEFFGSLDVLITGPWAQAVLNGQTKKRSTA